MIDQLTIQQLRALSIEGVAERVGLTVNRHKALCPFHDDSRPSLMFNVRKNSYRCYVCGAYGGPIDMVMNHLHKSFADSCRWLADESNIIIEQWKPSESKVREMGNTFDANRYGRFFEHPCINEAAHRFLYDERHLDPRVVRWCRLNSYRDKNGTDWLQIPYYDKEWNLVGVQNRRITDIPSPPPPLYVEGGDHPEPLGTVSLSGRNAPEAAPFGGRGACRFLFPRGSRCSVYNLPVLALLREGEPLYITEGASDCWAMLSSGHKAIAIPSATLLKESDLETLRALNSQLSTPFHMYPDNDTPGTRLYLELKERLPNLIHHQIPEGCKDFSDLWKSRHK